MATFESVMAGARTYLRDHPKMFAASLILDANARTFDLKKPNVKTGDISVRAVNGADTAIGVHTSTGTPADATHFTYDLDERNGMLRIVADRTGGMVGWNLLVDGYYCAWISDSDLRFFVENIIAEHGWHRESFDLGVIPDAEEDAMALGAAVGAAFALLAEFARDIDVSTVEGVHVPASQRFRQMEQLLLGSGGLQAQYSEKANALGIGLRAIEVGVLRRQSRTTGRLVPVYREREWDDQRWPQRVFPPISTPGPLSPPPGFSVVTTVEE